MCTRGRIAKILHQLEMLFCTRYTSRGEGRPNTLQNAFASQDAVRDIFDDRDFYVQLLKEVLSGGAGVLSQQDEEKQLLAEIQGHFSDVGLGL